MLLLVFSVCVHVCDCVVLQDRVEWKIGEPLPPLICLIENRHLILNAGVVQPSIGQRALRFYGESFLNMVAA